MFADVFRSRIPGSTQRRTEQSPAFQIAGEGRRRELGVTGGKGGQWRQSETFEAKVQAESSGEFEAMEPRFTARSQLGWCTRLAGLFCHVLGITL